MIKKIFFLILLNVSFSVIAQKIAFQKIDCKSYDSYSFVNDRIAYNLIDADLDVIKICNTELQFTYWDGGMGANDHVAGIDDRGILKSKNLEIAANNLSNLGYSYLLVPIESKRIYRICTSKDSLYKQNDIWWCRFYIYNLSNLKFKEIKLTISTSGATDLTLEACSNIRSFVSVIKDFVQEINLMNNGINSNKSQKIVAENEKLYATIGKNNKIGSKLKVVRVKERNLINNYPVSIDVYDKSLSLNVADEIFITKTELIKIPGEKKTLTSETTIGKAKITEAYNKPLFTAKLIGNAGANMKEYKDGDENYSVVRGEENKTVLPSPKIMVIPKKIDGSKFVNGEYHLSKDEKMLIAAFKNKFEDNKFTTFGFESSIKNVFEQRQFQNNTQEDIKSKILESSGMDFYVEYENLDQKNNNCEKVFDFKIRNYSTGEDVASDLKSLNVCGSPDDFKIFAGSILSSGAISKINKQFSNLVENGKKVSVVFTLSNYSSASFDKVFNGVKLGVHIENCLQELALNGNLDIEGVVNLRMETTVNIPVVDENSGKSYSTYMFSENIIEYLKKNAGINCKSSVSKQIVNIIIQ